MSRRRTLNPDLEISIQPEKNSITLKKVGLEAKLLVQEIMDEVPTYMLNSEGVQKRPDGAVQELTLVPPGCLPDQKIDFLVYRDTLAVGFVDLLLDFPDRGTVNLGLLAIRQRYQNKALGRLTYQAVETHIRDNFSCNKIRLGVNDTNPVQGFWKKMGFSPTGEIKPYKGVSRETSIIVMEKWIGDIQSKYASSNIDISLTEHTLTLSCEERIEAHESARQLVKDLQKAGQEFYARQSQASP